MRLEVNDSLKMVLCYVGVRLIFAMSFGEMRALGLNISSLTGKPFATWQE